MRKFLFILLSVLSLTAFAQTKKVAILEVVDRENTVAYAHKLVLRTHLEKAIIGVPGYEAYNRTDIDAIMNEHNFQRTGLVENEQIKQLGEMTGAEYILVAEAAKINDTTIYITAKILNVVTAKEEHAPVNRLMGVSPKEIKEGCEALAQELFGESTKKNLKKRNGPTIFVGLNGSLGGLYNTTKSTFGVLPGIGIDFAYPCSEKFAMGAFLKAGAGYHSERGVTYEGKLGILMLAGKLTERPFVLGIVPCTGAVVVGPHALLLPLEFRFGRLVSKHFYMTGNIAYGIATDLPEDSALEFSLTFGYHFGDKLRARK